MNNFLLYFLGTPSNVSMTVQNAKRKQNITEIAGKFIIHTTVTVTLLVENKSGEGKRLFRSLI